LENYTAILEAQGFAVKTHDVCYDTATRAKRNGFPAPRCLKAPDYCSFLALIGVGFLPAIEFAMPDNPTSEAEFGCRGAFLYLAMSAEGPPAGPSGHGVAPPNNGEIDR
jgi:hypothetical protein